jgi:hypothetical protein
MRDVAEVQHTHISETPRDLKSIAARYQDVIYVEFTPKKPKQIETVEVVKEGEE